MTSVLLMTVLATTPPAPDCSLRFVKADWGHFLAIQAEGCFLSNVERSLKRLSDNHVVEAVITGTIALSDNPKVTEVGEELQYRWYVPLGTSFKVPPSVATGFRRLEANIAKLPSLDKCIVDTDGFHIVLHVPKPYELYDVILEWAAFECDPPATPLGACDEVLQEACLERR